MPSPFDALNPRQREVAALLAIGTTNREIADRLFVSIKTIDTHRMVLLRRLNLRGNVALARLAIREGFVSMHDE